MQELTVFNAKEAIHSLVPRLVAKIENEHTRAAYQRGMNNFLAWYAGEGQPPLTAKAARDYIDALKEKGLGTDAINQHLVAFRRLVKEAVESGSLHPAAGAELLRVEGVAQRGKRVGNWLSKEEAQALLYAPDVGKLKGLRDRAILACFLGCGLRRSELANLAFENIQQRESRWAIVDIVGKGGRIRTVPMPSWCKVAIDEWAHASGLSAGPVFLAMAKGDRMTDKRISDRALHDVVAKYAPGISCHDLRRSHAKLAYAGGAALDQIQLTLGHASISTTEAYLGAELQLHNAPGDHVGLRI